MARRARRYEAFISYSHAADDKLARQLQRTLNRIARPSYKWWTWWPPRVFRDETNLLPGDLGGAIERALLSADSLVLLASPRAAASPWVDKEAATWLREKPPERLFLALTEGTIAWDDERRDFDPTSTDALPPSLRGAFEAEPLWVDFRSVREDRPFARDPAFLDGAASLAAAIRGVDKDGLVGEDVRQRRRARQLAIGAIATVAALAVAATIAAVVAFVQRGRAIDRERLALSRQLAAQAVAALDIDPEQSVALAARAATTAPTDEADAALRRALRTSLLRAVVDARAPVRDVDVATGASVVAAALANGEVRVWDTRTRAEVRAVSLGGSPALDISLSRDGNRVLGVSQRAAGVWSTSGDTAEPLVRLPARGRIVAAALSQDGELAATGHFGGAVRIWRVATRSLVRELRPDEPAAVTAVAFTRDGSRLAAAIGAFVHVWDMEGRRRARYRHESDVAALAFSPDGLRLATGDDEGVVRLWRTGARDAVVLVGHQGRVTSIAFSPDGRVVATASEDESARVWDVAAAQTTAELRGHTGLVLGLSFTRSGNSVVTGSFDRSLRFWAVAADPVRVTLPSPTEERVLDVAFDPTGKRIATSGRDRAVRVWDVERRSLVFEQQHGTEPDEWVEGVRFDSTGESVVSSSNDGTIRTWDAATGDERSTFGRPGGREVFDVALSPDEKLLVAGTSSGDALVRRRADGAVVARLRAGDGPVRAVAWSADGRHVVAASGRAVRVWRAPAFGKPAATLLDPGSDEENELWSVAVSPGGRRVAAGDTSGFWSLWDLDTGELVARAKANAEIVADVAFDTRGAYLATADWNGFAKVWRVPSGSLVTSRRTGASELEAVAWAPRTRLLAVAGHSGRVVVFECAECRPLHELVCLAARRVTPAVRARERDVFARCD